MQNTSSWRKRAVCPACLRAYEAQRREKKRKEKRREDSIETSCGENGCDREIVPGQARHVESLYRVKPICERCKSCQRVIETKLQKRRNKKGGTKGTAGCYPVR